MQRYIVANIENSEPLISTDYINVAVDKFTSVSEESGKDYVRESVEKYGVYGMGKYVLIDCEKYENIDDIYVTRYGEKLEYCEFVEEVKKNVRIFKISQVLD